MAVPQLQLANLGEIFAQNQARQAEMDTMQLQQASALEQMRQEQLARQKQSQLMELARTVDISKPEGARQAFELGLMDLPTYAGVQKSATDMALAQQRTETARIQGETSQKRLELDRQNIQSQIQNRTAQLQLSRAQEARMLREFNRGRDKTEIEIAQKLSQGMLAIPEEQRPAAYLALKDQFGGLVPSLFEDEGYSPEMGVVMQALANSSASQGPLSNVAQIEEDFRRGRLSQQQRDAAIAKATTTRGTRITTSPTGGVVIEEGGTPVGGAQTSPVGVTSQQSFVSRNLERLEDIATGKEGEAKRFFATGVPAATGALGAWTPAGVTRTLIDNVKGNMTIDKLVADRKASPTGASPFGNLTEKEMKIVKDSISTLENSQTEQEFLRNLRDTTDLYNDLTRGNPNEIVNFFLSGKVNPFDAADAIKRKNPQNYMLSVPSLAVIQNLPPALQSAMSGMQVRDQQTGQTITINAPTPSGGGQGGGWSIKLKQ